jgi:hypothetical protein
MTPRRSSADRLLLIPSADLRPGVRGGQLMAAINAAKQAGASSVVLMSVAGTREAPEISIESAGRVGGPLGRGTAYSITRKHRHRRAEVNGV